MSERPVWSHGPEGVELPPVHVPRPRLVTGLADVRIVLIDAPAGFGKSTLLTDLAAAAPRSLDVTADDLDDRLHEQLASATTPVLVTVDSLPATSAEVEPIVSFYSGLPAPHRLAVAGRLLPRDLATQLPGGVTLRAEQLAFDRSEVDELLTRTGVSADAPDHGAVWRYTSGWPALATAVAGRLAGRDATEAATSGLTRQVVAELVDPALATLPGDVASGVAALAHLPEFDDRTVEVATGVSGATEVIAAAGIALLRRSPGGLAFTEPVRRHLTATSPLPEDVARRVADDYRTRGMLRPTLQVLLAADLIDEAVHVVADAVGDDLGQLDAEMVQAVRDRASEATLSLHPEVTLQLARARRAAGHLRQRRGTLAEARQLAAATDDDRFRRRVAAEALRDAIHLESGPYTAQEAQAERLLAESGPQDPGLRARAHATLGSIATRHRGPGWADTAAAHLRRAADLHMEAGEMVLAAETLTELAYEVEAASGHLDSAAETVDGALELASGDLRQRGMTLTVRADIQLWLGDLTAADDDVAEARRIAARLADPHLTAYANWSAARVAATRGDEPAALAAVREVERQAAEWLDGSVKGTRFLAEAAVHLDLCGATALARRYLDRAVEGRDRDDPAVAAATFAIAARDGDARAALDRFAAVDLDRLRVPDRVRMLVLRAHAARRADVDDLPRLAAEPFEEAALIGRPDLPLVLEPSAARPLLQPAAAAGSGAAARIRDDVTAAGVVTVLGAFSVVHEGRPVDLPDGRPAQLVKLLAIHGGRARTLEIVEALWPDGDEDTGLARLRTVLSRLRRIAPIVERSGSHLAFTTGTEVDAIGFDVAARRALRRGPDAAAHARSAAARYGGELLPDDVLAGWAVVPRERLRRRYVEVLDLLVDDARADDEPDEALRWLLEAIEADPLDERRYLAAIEILVAQGRRAKARDIAARGARMMERFGLVPNVQLRAMLDDRR